MNELTQCSSEAVACKDFILLPALDLAK